MKTKISLYLYVNNKMGNQKHVAYLFNDVEVEDDLQMDEIVYDATGVRFENFRFNLSPKYDLRVTYTYDLTSTTRFVLKIDKPNKTKSI